MKQKRKRKKMKDKSNMLITKNILQAILIIEKLKKKCKIVS